MACEFNGNITWNPEFVIYDNFHSVGTSVYFSSVFHGAGIQYFFFFFVLLWIAWSICFLYKLTEVVSLFDSTIYLQKLCKLCKFKI